MSRTKIRQDQQIANTRTYNDAYADAHSAGGAKPVFNQSDLQHDLNVLRTNMKQLKGSADFYSQMDSESTLSSLKAEDGYIRSFVGKNAYGSETPDYNSHNINGGAVDVIGNSDSLELAIAKLDDGYTSNRVELNNLESSLGAMVNDAGSYVARSGTNYIDSNSTIDTDLRDLDSNLKRVEDGYANEDGFIRSFIGKSSIGSETPDYNARRTGLANASVQIIGNTDDLELAVTKLEDGYQSLQDELNAFTLQRAYDQDVNGSDALITTNSTDGSVIIAGTESLKIDATEGLDVNTKFDFDGSVFDVEMSSSNGFSIDGKAASNVSVAGADLTLSTITSGKVVVSAAGDGYISASGSNLDITAAGNLDMDAATVNMDSSSTMDLASGGAMKLDSASSLTLEATAKMLLDALATGSDALDINSAGGMDIDVAGAADLLAQSFSFKASQDGYISASGSNLDITAAGNLDMDAATVNMDSSSTMDLASVGAMKLDSASSLELEATGKLIFDADALSADAIDVDSAGGIDVDAVGAIALDAAGITLTSTGSNDVATVSGARITFDDATLSAAVAMTRGSTSVSTWSAGVSEAYGADAYFSNLGIVEAINELGDGYQSLSNEMDAFTLQRAYNQGKGAAGEDILIADNDSLNFRLAGNNALFQVSNDDGSKTLTVRDGYVQVDGYLLVTGGTTQIETTVTDADHMLLSPIAGSAVPALKIDADSGFTQDLLVVEKVGSSAVAFAIENDGDAYFSGDAYFQKMVRVLGVLDLDGSVDADVSSFDVLASGAISLDSNASSKFQTTSGDLDLKAAAELDLDGNAVKMDAVTTMDLASGGAMKLTSISSLELEADGKLILNADALGADALDIDSADGIDIDAVGATTLNAAGITLTSTGSNDVATVSGARITFDDATLSAVVAMTRGSTAVGTWSAGVDEAYTSGSASFASLGIVEAINALGDGYQSLSDELDAFTLQRAYNQDADGSDALITTNSTDGYVAIAGTEGLKVTAAKGMLVSNLLDLDGSVDADVSSFDVLASTLISLQAGAASKFETTAGDLDLKAFAELDLDGNVVKMDAATTMDLASGGAMKLDSASSLTLEATAKMLLDALATGSDALDINSAGGMDIDVAGAADLLAQSFSFKASQDGYISASGSNLDITTAGNLDMDAATVNMDSSSTMDLASGGAMKLDSASSLELEATGKLILDAQNAGADALDIDSAGGIQMNAVLAIAIDAGSSLTLEASAGDAYMNAIGGDVKLTASGDGYFDVAGELFLADSRSASTGGPSGAFRLSTESTGLADGDDFSVIVRGMAGVSAGAELGIINAINAIAAGSGSAFEKAVYVIGAVDPRVTSNRELLLTGTGLSGPSRGKIEIGQIGGDGYSSLFKAERDLEVWVNGVLMLPSDSPVNLGQVPADDYCLAANDLTKLIFSFDLVEGDIIVVKNNRPAAGENLSDGWSY